MATYQEVLRNSAKAVRRVPTIRSRVISLIAILLVPFFIVVAWMAGQLANARKSAMELERGAIAEKLTQILDQRIAGITGMLTGLASSEDLSSGDFESFERHSRAFARQPEIKALRVISPTGDTLSSTDVTAPQNIKASEINDIVSAVLRGQTVVSDVQQGAQKDDDMFLITIPVFRDGKVVYALSAEVVPEVFANIFERADLPDSWPSAVVDREGHFVARSINPKAYIGELARPELVKIANGETTSGQFENVTHEGLVVVNSFERSSVSGWTSVVAVPKAELERPWREMIGLLVIGGGLISVLSLALASLLAARIYAPVRQLRDETVALMSGKMLPEGDLHIAELNEVRQAFSQAITKSAHLAAIVASSNDAIVSTDLSGRVQSWNTGAEKLFGYTASEMIGRSKTTIIPEEKQGEFDKHLEAVMGKKSLRAETVRRDRDGRLIDVSLEVAPIVDGTGKVIAMSSILHDVTSRKETEKHQRFLMRELTHRSKNLLAIVQSMARQTARSAQSLSEFENQYMQRLQGLAASHDLLVNQNWAGAALDELVRRQVMPFVEEKGANLAIAGPDIMVSAKAAQAIGLALHELATNSMKHGALSTPKGKVSIDWEYLTSRGDAPQIQIQWEEHDGPEVQPPTRKGFGHFVIERMTTQTLQARVSLDFNPEGLIWTVIAPLSALQSEPEFEGADSIG